MSGMLVRAHTADYAQQESLPLPLDFDELLSTVSEAFALQRGSVRIRSKHAPTDLWVVLASQSQLMDAVREASESAMHMLTIEVSGRSARRTLDALMFALDLARLGAQVAYLWWLSEEGLSLTLGPYTVSPAAALGVLLLLSVLANSIVALSVLVTELSENGALRRWFGGARGRIAPLLCSPLTLETLPLVASGVCGLDAPLRAATRDGIIQWGVVGLLVHDVLVLLLVVGVHGLPGTSPLAPLAAVCLGTTALNVALNLPRRLVHFIVGAYRKSFEAYLAEHGTPPPLRAPPTKGRWRRWGRSARGASGMRGGRCGGGGSRSVGGRRPRPSGARSRADGCTCTRGDASPASGAAHARSCSATCSATSPLASARGGARRRRARPRGRSSSRGSRRRRSRAGVRCARRRAWADRRTRGWRRRRCG